MFFHFVTIVVQRNNFKLPSKIELDLQYLRYSALYLEPVRCRARPLQGSRVLHMLRSAMLRALCKQIE